MFSSKCWKKIIKCQAKKTKTNYKLKINNDIITDVKQVTELFAIKMKRTLNKISEAKFNHQFKRKYHAQNRKPSRRIQKKKVI